MYKVVEDKLAIDATQKCGSRTIIAYAMLIRKPKVIEENPNGFISRGSYQYTVPFEKRILLSHESAIELNYTRRLAIVRDPVSRFLSAYSNRVKFYTGSETLSVQDFIDSYENIPNIVPHHDTLDYSNKTQTYADAKFHMFSLVKRYGKNPNFYSGIFNLGQMNTVKEIIEDSAGKKLPNLKLNETYDEEKPALTNDQQNWIRDKFKEDIEVYGKWM